MLEQPLGSCMPQVPIFRSVWKFLQWNYVVVWLGAYGAESKKPIKVFAPTRWIANLKKPLDKKKTFERLCTTVDGKHTGKSKELKNSQHYPQEFGETIADVFARNVGVPPEREPKIRLANNFISRHNWDIAKLDAVHKWLDGIIAQLHQQEHN